MTKKLISLDAAESRAHFAAARQLAVVLGVLHWMRQLENSERFAFCEIEMVSIEDEWKLFVEATAFISRVEMMVNPTEVNTNRPFSEELSTIVGYLHISHQDEYLFRGKVNTISRHDEHLFARR